MPRVSVILTSFNHAAYLNESIDSVLGQTFSDIELIVLDDASRDNSWALISRYADQRMRGYLSPAPGEVVHRVNHALSNAVGEYIAVQHSDDVWKLEKLERQVAYLDAHPEVGAVFTWVQVIDETGSKIEKDWFNRPNQSQWAWLNELFNQKNTLNHPSALIRKRCYEEIGGYRYGLAQTDDAEFWSRLLIRYPIHVLEEKLTLHRLFSNNSNVSGDRPEVAVRSSHEWNFLRENLLALPGFDEVVQVFPELECWRHLSGFNIKFLLAMACVRSPHRSAWPLGLRWLFELLNDTMQRNQIAELYGFTDLSFVELSATLDSYLIDAIKQQHRTVAEYEAKLRGVLSEYAALQSVLAERDTMLQDAISEHSRNVERVQEEYSRAAQVAQEMHHEALGVFAAKFEELRLAQIEIDREVVELRCLAETEGARADAECKRASAEQHIAEVAKLEAFQQYEQVQNVDMQRQIIAARLAAFEASSSWRVTAPIRRLLVNQPRAARTIRRMAKLIWWSVTFRLLRKSREWQARQRAVSHSATEPMFTSFSSNEQDTATASAVEAAFPAAAPVDPPYPPSPDVDKLLRWLAASKEHLVRNNCPRLTRELMLRYFETLEFASGTVRAWTDLLETLGTQQPEASAEFELAVASFKSHARIDDFAVYLQNSSLFDAAFYRAQIAIEGTHVDAIRHYLLIGEPLGIRPSLAFDPSYYGRKYPDVAESGMNCLFHYIVAGQNEGRRATAPPIPHKIGAKAIDPEKENVIIVVHETSRTGAPILGWNIAVTLARKYNVFSVLLGDGALTPEFEAVSSEAIGPFNGVRTSFLEAEYGLVPLFASRTFKYAIVNSIESRVIIEVCARRLIPTVLLVHEYGSYVWPASALGNALDMATEVVFPASSVALSSLEVHPPLRERGYHIETQGMSSLPSDHAKTKHPENGLMRILVQKRAGGTLIVTGVGTVNLRKGVDSFIAIAAYVKRLGATRPIHFLWVGGGYRPNDDMGYSIYLKEQMRRADVEADITFMEEVSDLEPIYAFSDLFMLASRLDPLPNVSIDAVQRGIPTICFKEGSGMADLLLANPETAVGVVPYMDAHAAAEVIVHLASDEAARARLSEATLRFAASMFDMERYVHRLDRLGVGHSTIDVQSRKRGRAEW
jgi:glycosyltransferase involved in cell wall biosynthesis